MKVKLPYVILCAATLQLVFGNALAEDTYPPKMLADAACFQDHGLIQGSVEDVLQGKAHFALYYKTTAIGGRAPSIRFNGDFVEGHTPISPDVLKTCNPNLTLEKMPD